MSALPKPLLSHDVVQAQYEKYIYPEPVYDLDEHCGMGVMDGGAPELLHWLYWPNGWYLRQKRKEIDILVAGCGANAAARYAYTHPKARVVGVDLSSASLAHEEYLKQKHQLTNLTLHQMPLEEVAQLGQAFDFIDSTGVLHHLPDPVCGLKALKSVLRPEGVISMMLYGLYGRMGVYLLQELFDRLGLKQNDVDLEMIRQALTYLHPDFIGRPMIVKSHDLSYDAGLVDLFLHKIDRGYTVEGCLDYVKACDLQFGGWIDNGYYYPDAWMSSRCDLYHRINAQSDEQIWAANELFLGRIAKHSFFATHPSRSFSKTLPDVEGDAFWDYVPHRRIYKVTQPDAAAGKPPSIVRPPFPEVPLNYRQALIHNQINGENTVRQIVERCGISDSKASIEQSVRNFLRSLWRFGYLMFEMPDAN